jgi:hypothetical protein
MKKTVFLAALLLPVGAFAASKDGGELATDTTTLQLVQYFLKTPTADASPKLIDPFLAVNTDALPKKIRGKAAAKQVEINALLRLHDTKKKGSFIQPAEGCNAHDFVKPLSMLAYFPDPGYETVTEDELKYVMDKTKCTEDDLGCRFSMLIFFQEKKDRVVKFNASDPIMALVAEARGKGGSTHFFGAGLTCMH